MSVAKQSVSSNLADQVVVTSLSVADCHEVGRSRATDTREGPTDEQGRPDAAIHPDLEWEFGPGGTDLATGSRLPLRVTRFCALMRDGG